MSHPELTRRLLDAVYVRLISDWTDEEWTYIMKTFTPDVELFTVIDHIKHRREGQVLLRNPELLESLEQMKNGQTKRARVNEEGEVEFLDNNVGPSD